VGKNRIFELVSKTEVLEQPYLLPKKFPSKLKQNGDSDPYIL
jgi:hypothetical protein